MVSNQRRSWEDRIESYPLFMHYECTIWIKVTGLVVVSLFCGDGDERTDSITSGTCLNGGIAMNRSA
jgi:hypothetical protein